MTTDDYDYDEDVYSKLNTDQIRGLLKPTWLSEDVKTMIIDRFVSSGALPILADALEESGCTDDALLLHLRFAHGEFNTMGCCAVADALREVFVENLPVGSC